MKIYFVYIKGNYGDPDELAYVFKTRELAERFIHVAGIKWSALTYYITEEEMYGEEFFNIKGNDIENMALKLEDDILHALDIYPTDHIDIAIDLWKNECFLMYHSSNNSFPIFNNYYCIDYIGKETIYKLADKYSLGIAEI